MAASLACYWLVGVLPPSSRWRPPICRVNGSLRPLDRGPIDDAEMVRLCFPMMNERTRGVFDENGGADFAYTYADGESIHDGGALFR